MAAAETTAEVEVEKEEVAAGLVRVAAVVVAEAEERAARAAAKDAVGAAGEAENPADATGVALGVEAQKEEMMAV